MAFAGAQTHSPYRAPNKGSSIDAGLDGDHLKAVNAPSSDEIAVVTLKFCPTSRPGKMGEARGAVMAIVTPSH